MGKLAIQDTFEPYYEGRMNKNLFATIDPIAVEKAKRLKERLEALRVAGQDNGGRTAAA